jgi:hypothetical protein
MLWLYVAVFRQNGEGSSCQLVCEGGLKYTSGRRSTTARTPLVRRLECTLCCSWLAAVSCMNCVLTSCVAPDSQSCCAGEEAVACCGYMWLFLV